jgi:hypothetical protein
MDIWYHYQTYDIILYESYMIYHMISYMSHNLRSYNYLWYHVQYIWYHWTISIDDIIIWYTDIIFWIMYTDIMNGFRELSIAKSVWKTFNHPFQIGQSLHPNHSQLARRLRPRTAPTWPPPARHLWVSVRLGLSHLEPLPFPERVLYVGHVLRVLECVEPHECGGGNLLSEPCGTRIGSATGASVWENSHKALQVTGRRWRAWKS